MGILQLLLLDYQSTSDSWSDTVVLQRVDGIDALIRPSPLFAMHLITLLCSFGK